MIETNDRIVNDIYLATMGKDVDEFTASQTSTLFDIANQCPMLGGNAVYRARALYSWIADKIELDDALLRAAHGFVVKFNAPAAPQVKVHPVSSCNWQITEVRRFVVEQNFAGHRMGSRRLTWRSNAEW